MRRKSYRRRVGRVGRRSVRNRGRRNRSRRTRSVKLSRGGMRI